MMYIQAEAQEFAPVVEIWIILVRESIIVWKGIVGVPKGIITFAFVM